MGIYKNLTVNYPCRSNHTSLHISNSDTGTDHKTSLRLSFSDCSFDIKSILIKIFTLI